MTKTMQVQTIDGLVSMPLIHKNGALQVVKASTQDPDFFYYNTVHNNGFKIPETDTDIAINAILICDWCVANFSEFSTEIFKMSKTRQDEFKKRLYKFRIVQGEDLQIKDWGNDND